MSTTQIPAPAVDRKGKGRAISPPVDSPLLGSVPLVDEHPFPPARESERWTAANVWRESRRRAKTDRQSWDYGAFEGKLAPSISGDRGQFD